MVPVRKGIDNQKGIGVVLMAKSDSKQCHLQAWANTLDTGNTGSEYTDTQRKFMEQKQNSILVQSMQSEVR